MGATLLPVGRLQGGAQGAAGGSDLAHVAPVSRAKAGVKKDAVRAEVRALVHGPSYMTFDDVAAPFPMKHLNTRPPNTPYTPWHPLQHHRIAHRQRLEY